jgi:hypothetical protein
VIGLDARVGIPEKAVHEPLQLEEHATTSVVSTP